MSDPWTRIELREADITKLDCDAIVNAAKNSLLGGGGVDGAIHRAAGPQLLEECRTLGGCPTGEAKITRGYNLPSQHVIHTVGPVYNDGRHGEPALLQACHENALGLAIQHNIRTIAFPAISCGVYGYPIPDAAKITLRTTAAFLEQHDAIQLVIFALFGKQTLAEFERASQTLMRD